MQGQLFNIPFIVLNYSYKDLIEILQAIYHYNSGSKSKPNQNRKELSDEINSTHPVQW